MPAKSARLYDLDPHLLQELGKVGRVGMNDDFLSGLSLKRTVHDKLGHSRPVALKDVRWRHFRLDLHSAGVLGCVESSTSGRLPG